MLETIKRFFAPRNIIDEERHPPYVKFLVQMIKWDMKLITAFEQKMNTDKDFEIHVLSKPMIDKDIKTLEKFPDDPGTYQGDIDGDMNERYKAIVKIMEGYLGKNYASQR